VPVTTPPIVLIFGPFDPSGSSALPADAITSATLGCHPLSVLTGTLVRDTVVIENLEPANPELMNDQARCLLEDMPVHAIKAGSLYTTDSVAVLAQILADYNDIPLVVHLQHLAAITAETDFDTEDTQAALLELVLPQADVVVSDHMLLQQWQSHGILPGHTLDAAIDALLAYGASSMLVTGAPDDRMQRGYFLRDENGQTAQWSIPSGPTVMDIDGLLTTAITAALAQGNELAQAVEKGVNLTRDMLQRAFQPGMGGRILDRRPDLDFSRD